jgi:hypothetical protein
LTDQQEALLGCGSFYGTTCDLDGFELFHAEASALFQAFVGLSPCTRLLGETPVLLPGCRGPADAGWEPNVDGSSQPGTGHAAYANLRFLRPGFDGFRAGDFSGTAQTSSLVHPFTGQSFTNELAAVSWNLMMLASALSSAVDTDDAGAAGGAGTDGFDPANPFRLDGCSYVKPQLCADVRSLQNFTTAHLDDDPRADGAPLHWVWEIGAEFEVTAASGDLSGFAPANGRSWRLHVFGPERSRVPGTEAGVVLFLSPPRDAQDAPLLPIPDSPITVRTRGIDAILGTADDPFAGLAYGAVGTP